MDIKTQLIKPLDEIIMDNSIMYTVQTDNTKIYNGFIYSPSQNPCLKILIDHFLKHYKRITEYHIFCKYYGNVIKKLTNQSYLQNKLYKISNYPDIYLFDEIITRSIKECPDGLDRYGLCSYIYDKKKKIIKTRYSDYPWK